ncbi:MAG TPA: hypothetical protein VL156_02935 [Terriglobales bacterium]|jgi:hypothetical protein|nr:hypothetical protein [Terriglobales bacterium]
MPSRRLLCVATAVFSFACLGQTPPPVKQTARAESKQQAKLTPEQERGLRLLKAAESGAAGLEPDMRAFVLWRVGHAYTKVDAKKAFSVAKDSFIASEAIDDPTDTNQCGPTGSAGDIKSWVQERVLAEMVRTERISEAEELLPSATTHVQTQIITQLVQYYIGKKDFNHALTFLSQLADASEYPFGAAADLLSSLGPERSGDRMTIFNQALNNFEQHGASEGFTTDDIGTFIEKTWTHVPPELALEGIDKVLEKTKSEESHSHYSMSSEKGSIALKSPYELRLFQLLPVLQELDKDKADSLLRDDAEMQAQLKKYPSGMASLTSNGGLSSYGVSDDVTPSTVAASANQQIAQQVMHRTIEVIQEAGKDPAQALSDALGLPLQGQGPMHQSPRVNALMEIAKGEAKQKPAIAKSALDEIVKVGDQLTPQEIAGTSSMPKIYLDLGDEEAAKRAIKVLVKAAEKLYARDTDSDDPNKAFKGTWPSADLWTKCVQAAAKISPALAEEIIAEISDPDIAAAQRVAFATSLLGASGESMIVSDCRKNWAGFTMSTESP